VSLKSRILISMMLAVVGSVIHPLTVLAFPPLPSSLYGTIKQNNSNVPDGTVITVLIQNKIVARGYTQTYQGDSVYSLDVPGDDTDTQSVDGGITGDTLVFNIGGLLAEQTGIWSGGTNVKLNLTVHSDSTMTPPLPTPTALPSQTPIVVANIYKTPIANSTLSDKFVPVTGGVIQTPVVIEPTSASPVKENIVSYLNANPRMVYFVLFVLIFLLICLSLLYFYLRVKDKLE
jgi:hypothetical protein